MVATWSEPVLRALTKIVGLVLIALGIVGVVVGTEPLLGLFNLDHLENIIHLLTGALLTYAGFRSPEPQLRKVVGTLGVLSLGAGIPGGPEALANQWKIGEETAAKHGKTMDRKNWKLVVNVHVAEDDEEAMRQVKRAERHETVTYFEETLGRPPGRSDDPLTEGVKMGTTLVGSVDTVVRGIKHLETLSGGGFGGLLFRAHEWATREQTLKSYELFARYVMPRFQGSGEMPRGSNEWARENRRTIFSPNVEAIRQAYTNAGREAPAEFRQRTSGARDLDTPGTTP